MATISAVLLVYNEERRIEATLRCASWCDEIIVLDKQSTDRTREVAKKYTDKICKIPYSEFDPNDIQRALDCASGEWVLFLVASDILHPTLAAQIRELIERDDFLYDVIHVPYRRYVLGLETSRSPWYSELHPAVARKWVVKINCDSVHGATIFDTKRHYKMINSNEYCMYHLTHETVDSMMERHLLYSRAEGRLFPSDLPLRKAINSMLRSAYDVLFKRKSFLMGWDGISLGIAFLTYRMLRFLYIWEQRRSAAPQTYSDIRDMVAQAWEENAKIEDGYGRK